MNLTETSKIECLLLIELLICFILYPTWLFPLVSDVSHLFIVIIILILILIFSVLLFYVNSILSSENKDPLLFVKEEGKIGNKIVIGIFTLYGLFIFFLKFTFLKMQFRIRGDEGTHIVRVLLFKNILTINGIIPDFVFAVLIYLAIGTTIMAFYLVQKNEKYKYVVKALINRIQRKYVFVFIILFFLTCIFAYASLLLIATSASRAQYYGSIKPIFARYGPINPIIGTIFMFIFGYSEFWLHMIPLLFTLFSMVFFYKLVRIYRSDHFAMFISIIIPLIPNVYKYTSRYYLASGVLFFSIACFYYFHKNLQGINKHDLNMLLFFYVTGFLYKRVMLFTLISLYSFLFIVILYRRIYYKKIDFNEIKIWSLYLILALIPTLLWMALSSEHSREFIFVPEQLISEMFTYPSLFPYMVSFLWVFAVTIPISILVFKDNLTFSSLVLSATFYLIFTTDGGWTIGETTTRFMIPILPFIILCSLQVLDPIIDKGTSLSFWKITFKTKQKIKWIVWSIITLLVITPLAIQGYDNNENEINSRLPFDETAIFLKNNLTEQDTLLMVFGPNPMEFYRQKHKLACDIQYEYRIFDSPDSIINYMIENNCQYLALPDHIFIPDVISLESYNQIFEDPILIYYNSITSEYNMSIFIFKLI